MFKPGDVIICTEGSDDKCYNKGETYIVKKHNGLVVFTERDSIGNTTNAWITRYFVLKAKMEFDNDLKELLE